MKQRVKVFIQCAVIIFTQCSITYGFLVTEPRDKIVAVVGETVHIHCSTNESYSINWHHQPISSTSFREVYISMEVVSPYGQGFSVKRNATENNVAHYDLIITHVQQQDAGKYKCIDKAGMGEEKVAELTVLDSVPNCTSNINSSGLFGENDCGVQQETIRCSCNVNYTGNIEPTMKWGIYPKNVILLENKPKITGRSVSSDINFSAIATLNMSSITWFLEGSTQINWTSEKIKIRYVKENLSPIGEIESNTKVSCLVNSSEKCEYRWRIIQRPSLTVETVNGSVLMISTPGSYRCEAICTLGQCICVVTALQVEYTGNSYPIVNREAQRFKSSSAASQTGKKPTTVNVILVVVIIILSSSS